MTQAFRQASYIEAMEHTTGEQDQLATEEATADAGVEEELLVEEISIDGMCGVY